ncbi:MAG: FAD synthase [Candidatus Kerfeldbacteria bacterium]|nr:FAD synthase [Candidatus Kerfeldbacteria bacterium]
MSHPSIIMVFGTFDVLHPGHIDFFVQAKELGDRLVVVVARDSNVTKIKGRPPRHTEDERLRDVKAIALVDEAVLGSETDPYTVIETYRPATIALGYDQSHAFVDHLQKELTRRNLHPRVIRLAAYHPDKYKSSKL